jgi:hypothetical protein
VTFLQWVDAVDAAVLDIAGVSVHDLPDVPFRFWFDDEMPPVEAAHLALEEAGWAS